MPATSFVALFFFIAVSPGGILAAALPAGSGRAPAAASGEESISVEEERPESQASPSDSAPRRVAGKSPGRAVLLSLAIPGGGQVYTGHWWKAALIAPAEVTLAVLAVREHFNAGAARQAGDEPAYLVMRDRRNTLLFFTGTVLAYAMADAWVSARMYAFDRQMEFAIGPGRAGLNVGF